MHSRDLVGQLASALATVKAMEPGFDESSARLGRSMKRQLEFLLEVAELLHRQQRTERKETRLRLVHGERKKR